MRERGGSGLREFAAQTLSDPLTYALPISKTSLARFENGSLPSLKYARDLDALYGADGWIELSMSALWKPRWRPWDDGAPRKYHAFRWPASYQGVVWFEVRAQRDSSEPTHALEVRWGPWRLTLERTIPASGETFWTGKSRDADGVATSLELKSSLPVHVLFGADLESAGEHLVDIRSLWRRDDG